MNSARYGFWLVTAILLCSGNELFSMERFDRDNGQKGQYYRVDDDINNKRIIQSIGGNIRKKIKEIHSEFINFEKLGTEAKLALIQLHKEELKNLCQFHEADLKMRNLIAIGAGVGRRSSDETFGKNEKRLGFILGVISKDFPDEKKKILGIGKEWSIMRSIFSHLLKSPSREKVE